MMITGEWNNYSHSIEHLSTIIRIVRDCAALVFLVAATYVVFQALPIIDVIRKQSIPKTNEILNNANLLVVNAHRSVDEVNGILSENRQVIKSGVRDFQLAGMELRGFVTGQSDEWFAPQAILSRKHTLQIGEQFIATLEQYRQVAERLDARVNGDDGLIVALNTTVRVLGEQGVLTSKQLNALLASPEWQESLQNVARLSAALADSGDSVRTGLERLPATTAHLEASAGNLEEISGLVRAFLSEQKKVNKLVIALRIIGAIMPIATIGK